MSNRLRRILALMAAVLMITTTFASTASADTVARGDAANASPAVDAIFLRLTGIVSLVIGTGLFLVATPFVLVTRPHEIDRPFKQLVMGPAKYIWVDPIGSH